MADVSRIGNDRTAVQIGKVLDARVLPGQKTCADHKDRIGKGHLLRPFRVVGGGGAFDIDGPVLQQRDAVLRRDGNRADRKVG